MAHASTIVVGVDNDTHRRRFNPEEYAELARQRQKREEEEDKQSKSRGPHVQRKPLKHRTHYINLEARLGQIHVLNPTLPPSQHAGYSCSACECVVKDSASFLDHINGKKHQRKACGMSMRVERATLEKVQSRLEKQEALFTELDFDERVAEQLREEKERKRRRRERGKNNRIEGEGELAERILDHEVAALIGFGGFSSSKK